MLKRIITAVLAATLLFCLASCAKPLKKDYKIGIITGDAGLFPEEYNTALALKEEYEGKVFVAQYPDPSKLKVGTPELVSVALKLADTNKPDAMIFAQAVVNTSDAVAAVKKKYPKMLIVCASPEEEIKTIAGRADLVFTVDETSYAKQLVEKAKANGASTFIDYSFKRHTNNSLFAARNKAIEDACKNLKLKYVYVNSVDPRTFMGIEGAKRFIAEDISRKIKEYGKKTAFFSSDYFVQGQMVKSVVEYGAILAGTANPSPFTGFPGALDLKVTKGWQDGEEFIESLKIKVKGLKTEAKLSTWSVPSGSLMLRAAAEYLSSYFDGKTEGSLDKEKITSTTLKLAGGDKYCTVGNYKADKDTVLKNCFTVFCESTDIQS